MSLYAKAAAAVLVVVALLAGWVRLTAYHEAKGYERAQKECAARAEQQREANRKNTRKAEQRHAKKAQARERYLVTTVREIRHETDNLASCTLSAPARQRLLDAAACAAEDRTAACGAGD